ncbi:MAG: cysteine synthase A [Clostridia bacterium]|nr:cysteine synthase A [Clostridia bacterium]
MGRICKSVEQLIGNTPLLELENIRKEYKLKSKIIVKIESFNVAGSVKDRVALEMINEAEKSGKLKKGGVIIEPTSGNTGIGLACIAAVRGYKLIIVMPDTMSEERRKVIKAYGAEIVLTDGKKGMKGSIEKAEELSREIENSFIAGQFENPANTRAHYKTTAPEIWEAAKGEVDYFIAGVGTGGTISGVGKYLKEKKPEIKVIAVEPKKSPVLSKSTAGSHNIQGIGAGFVPKILDTNIYDEVIAVSDEDAINMGKELCRKEGLSVGISSGAAVYAAVEKAKELDDEKNIVVLLPDTASRYYSTELFDIN